MSISRSHCRNNRPGSELPTVAVARCAAAACLACRGHVALNDRKPGTISLQCQWWSLRRTCTCTAIHDKVAQHTHARIRARAQCSTYPRAHTRSRINKCTACRWRHTFRCRDDGRDDAAQQPRARVAAAGHMLVEERIVGHEVAAPREVRIAVNERRTQSLARGGDCSAAHSLGLYPAGACWTFVPAGGTGHIRTCTHEASRQAPLAEKIPTLRQEGQC
jgi:hypothetical protein